MALKRSCALLILLLLAEWASGVASPCPAPTPSQRPRVSRLVVPLAMRHARQLRQHITLPPPPAPTLRPPAPLPPASAPLPGAPHAPFTSSADRPSALVSLQC
jgi:hypothetical protein